MPSGNGPKGWPGKPAKGTTCGRRDRAADRDICLPNSAANFETLFDEIVELYARPETPRKVPEEKPSGRTLDELLQSPIWELELTCSPIEETPEKVTPEAPRPQGRNTSRQLFLDDDRENQAPINRPRGSGHLTRLAPGRRIQLIPPSPEDPQTRCLGSPVRAKLAPRQTQATRPLPYQL